MKYGVSFNTDFLLNWILTINQADLIKLVQKKETHVDKAFFREYSRRTCTCTAVNQPVDKYTP